MTEHRYATARLLREFLRGQPEIQVSEGPLGELFQLGGRRVAVPYDWGEDTALARETIERAAAMLRLDPTRVAVHSGAREDDTLFIRLLGSLLGRGFAPLGLADAALHNGRRLIESAATSVVKPVRSINSKYHARAIRLSKESRLWHTRDGSFIFPISVDVGSVGADDLSTPEVRLSPEPYGRRATRTLAQALTVTRRLVEEDIDSLSEDALGEAATLGVTREVCLSISEILRDPHVDSVEFSFSWSEAVSRPPDLTDAVTFEASHLAETRKLARRLSSSVAPLAEQFSGTILEIGHDAGLSEYFFVLGTYRYQAPVQLRVFVSAEAHYGAIPWYRDRQTVFVRGRVSETSGGVTMRAPETVKVFLSDRLV